MVEADVGAERARRVQKDRLQHVLRRVAHLAGAGRLVVGTAVVAGAPRHHAGQLASGERGGEHLLAHQMVRQRAASDLRLDPQVAKDLHRALIGDVRARRIRGVAVLRQGQRPNAQARQQRRRGEPGGPGTDDENVRSDCFHSAPPGPRRPFEFRYSTDKYQLDLRLSTE
jgi:hypothetical protein